MPDPFPFSALLIAGFGGFCLNMMNLLEDSKRLPVDRVDKDITYWIFFAFWPILGSGLTFIYIQSGYNVDGDFGVHDRLIWTNYIADIDDQVCDPRKSDLTRATRSKMKRQNKSEMATPRKSSNQIGS